MKRVILGKTGIEISNVGLGGIPVQRITPEKTRELLEELAERGINYIDTARGYTVSEAYLGQALEGMRDRFVLATKSMSRDREHMAEDIKTSLKNLRTDYIDLYQVHNPSMEQLDQILAPGGALEALTEAKEQGKIGHLGLTAHSAQVFERALDLPWVETIMFPYNIVETQGEELIAKCRERGIGFICMKPLAGGAVEDARLALRFIASNENVTVVIPGMYDREEVEENCRAVEEKGPLTEEEKEKIEKIRRELGSNFCRRCNYCAPCTVGIQIPSVFLFEGYLSRYNLEGWARERYSTLAVKASACVECGACESRCPYQLPIREMLKRCARSFGE